jgi:hypothetical protein
VRNSSADAISANAGTLKRDAPRVLLLNDTAITGHPGCVRVVGALVAGLEKQGLSVVARCPVGVDPFRWPPTRLGLQTADAIVVNAEGTLHHAARRKKARKLAAIAKRIKCVRDIPVIAVNATVEALEPLDFENLRTFDRIYARESKSLAYLEANGVECAFAPDLSLADEKPIYTGARHGLFVSDSIVSELADALQRFAEARGVSSANMRPSLFWAYPSYMFWPSALDNMAKQFITRIVQSEAVVTGRFHTMMFCIATRTPFIAVGSNSEKIAAVLQDALGSTSRQVDVKALTPELRVPAFTTTELQLLSAYVTRAKTMIDTMFESISASIHKHRQERQS